MRAAIASRWPIDWSRLLFSRAAPFALPLLFRFSKRLATRIQAEVAQFRPQAILTVANGIYWKVAAEIANKMNIPLHLIVHDAVLQAIADGCRL